MASYVARQPIYDGNGAVEAYELLHRAGNFGSAGEVGIAESATMLVDAIGAFGLNTLVRSKRAFLNISEELLLSGCLNMLPQDRVVLEVLENVDPKPEVLRAVKDLKAQGYILALDDYTGQPELEAFLPLVQVVKFEVLNADPVAFAPRVRALKAAGKKLLAEKVETLDEYRLWKKMGFSLFQGYFFAKPEVMQGRGAVCCHQSLVHLLAKLSDPNIGFEAIERIIATDPGLSFRLLKMLRSAALGVPSKLHSIHEAVLFIGLKRTGALATILMLSSIPRKSSELLQTILVRAHFCEAIAKEMRLPTPDAFFTLGLFSLLDAMLDMPIEEAIGQLPLSEEVAEAITNPNAPTIFGDVLRFVIGWERGNPQQLPLYKQESTSLGQLYVRALARTDELMSSCLGNA